MSGEMNGTAVVLNNTTGEVVGQGDFTHTYGSTPIEIGNKSTGDAIVYLDAEGSGKQHIFSGEFTYNDDEQFRKVRADSFSNTMDDYTVTYIGSGSGGGIDESFSGTFMPTGLSDSLPQGAKVATTLSFNSSGDVVIIAATTV